MNFLFLFPNFILKKKSTYPKIVLNIQQNLIKVARRPQKL